MGWLAGLFSSGGGAAAGSAAGYGGASTIGSALGSAAGYAAPLASMAAQMTGASPVLNALGQGLSQLGYGGIGQTLQGIGSGALGNGALGSAGASALGGPIPTNISFEGAMPTLPAGLTSPVPSAQAMAAKKSQEGLGNLPGMKQVGDVLGYVLGGQAGGSKSANPMTPPRVGQIAPPPGFQPQPQQPGQFYLGPDGILRYGQAGAM